jgi:hypothetical protein
MRTTLNLDDDPLDIIREYSEQRALALGKAASEFSAQGRGVHNTDSIGRWFRRVQRPGGRT